MPKDPNLNITLFIPHLTLAIIVVILLIISFIHYHIKHKKRKKMPKLAKTSNTFRNPKKKFRCQSCNIGNPIFAASVTSLNIVQQHGRPTGNGTVSHTSSYVDENERRKDNVKGKKKARNEEKESDNTVVELHPQSLQSMSSVSGLSGV